MKIESLEDIKSLPQPALGLLAAQHDAVVTDHTAGELPAAADHAGSVFGNGTAGALTLPAYEGWPATRLAVGGFCASDGRLWYEVVQKAGTNSFYPKAFERTLYTLSFTPDSLASGDTWELDRQYGFRALVNNCVARWSVIWEIGLRVDTASPSPVGPNIEGFTWRTPLIDQDIVLTDVATNHRLGVVLSRKLTNGVDVWSGSVKRYAKALGALPEQLPPDDTGDFVLRLRLAHFDIENITGTPRGYVAYHCGPIKDE